MEQKKQNFAIPLSFIGIMFFAIGFALGFNSLLAPVLQDSLRISNAAFYLFILSANQKSSSLFLPYFLFILYYGVAGYKIRTI